MAMVTVVEGRTQYARGQRGNPANLSQEVDVKDSGPYGNMTGGVALVQGGGRGVDEPGRQIEIQRGGVA